MYLGTVVILLGWIFAPFTAFFDTCRHEGMHGVSVFLFFSVVGITMACYTIAAWFVLRILNSTTSSSGNDDVNEEEEEEAEGDEAPFAADLQSNVAEIRARYRRAQRGRIVAIALFFLGLFLMIGVAYIAMGCPGEAVFWTQDECIASGKSRQYCTVDLYVPSISNETCLYNNTRCAERHTVGAAGQHVVILSMNVYMLTVAYDFLYVAPLVVALGTVVTGGNHPGRKRERAAPKSATLYITLTDVTQV